MAKEPLDNFLCSPRSPQIFSGSKLHVISCFCNCDKKLQAHVTEEVTATVLSVLGHVPLPEQPLMEAGLDSLGAVELRNSLANRFGHELSATLIFDYPTIAALSGFLAERLPSPGEDQQAIWSPAGSWSAEVRLCFHDFL